jgi:hypothetical protein
VCSSDLGLIREFQGTNLDEMSVDDVEKLFADRFVIPSPQATQKVQAAPADAFTDLFRVAAAQEQIPAGDRQGPFEGDAIFGAASSSRTSSRLQAGIAPETPHGGLQDRSQTPQHFHMTTSTSSHVEVSESPEQTRLAKLLEKHGVDKEVANFLIKLATYVFKGHNKNMFCTSINLIVKGDAASGSKAKELYESLALTRQDKDPAEVLRDALENQQWNSVSGWMEFFKHLVVRAIRMTRLCSDKTSYEIRKELLSELKEVARVVHQKTVQVHKTPLDAVRECDQLSTPCSQAALELIEAAQKGSSWVTTVALQAEDTGVALAGRA